MEASRKAPSLVKICIGTVIANLRYVGNVGGIDTHLLEEILPHCTVDQLMHIEGSTEEYDLSPVTNNLWKRFYEQHFGEENNNLVVTRMNQKQVFFNWRNLYQAKTIEWKEYQNKLAKILKKRYKEELAISSTYNVSHIKGNLLKKPRLEYLKRSSHSSKFISPVGKRKMQG